MKNILEAKTRPQPDELFKIYNQPGTIWIFRKQSKIDNNNKIEVKIKIKPKFLKLFTDLGTKRFKVRD